MYELSAAIITRTTWLKGFDRLMSDSDSDLSDVGFEGPLGRGFAGAVAFKLAVCLAYFGIGKLLRLQWIAKGAKWPGENKKNAHPRRQVIARMFSISQTTVREYWKKRALLYQRGTRKDAEPQKRGAKKIDARAQYPDLYKVLSDKIKHAQKNGYIVTIPKLLVHLQDAYAENFGEGVMISDSALRYYMLRMGFQWGRISRKLKSGRTKDYVLAWLHKYAGHRADFAQKPSTKVLCFLDETFLHQDATGDFSWFLASDHTPRAWATGVLPKTRWGIVQCVFSHWEEVPGAQPYGLRKKRCVREGSHFAETLYVWNCVDGRKKNNMNSDRFLAYLRATCEFAQKKFPGREIEFHMDNASYHKKADPDTINVEKASRGDIILYMIEHAPDDCGMDSASAFQDGEGRLLPLATVRQMAREYAPPNPTLVAQILAEFKFTVCWTPPYWPQVQPIELWNGGMKHDYRGWDTKDKQKDVAASVRLYAENVSDSEVASLIRHTDDFCSAVCKGDKKVLGPLVVSALYG